MVWRQRRQTAWNIFIWQTVQLQQRPGIDQERLILFQPGEQFFDQYLSDSFRPGALLVKSPDKESNVIQIGNCNPSLAAGDQTVVRKIRGSHNRSAFIRDVQLGVVVQVTGIHGRKLVLVREDDRWAVGLPRRTGQEAADFDAVVVNDDLEKALDCLVPAVRACVDGIKGR